MFITNIFKTDRIGFTKHTSNFNVPITRSRGKLYSNKHLSVIKNKDPELRRILAQRAHFFKVAS